MRTGRVIAAGAIGATAALAAVAMRAVRGVQAPAAGDVTSFLALPHEERERRPVVAITGASIVRGRAGVDWVRMLRERFPELAFVNDGVNSRLAWEVLGTTDDVIACGPSRVVILVGTNDVEATLAADGGAGVQRAKHLPQRPSLDFYGACLADAIGRFTDAGAEVAVCSLPPLGQRLSDAVNQRVREANRVAATVCEARGAAYLPVGEAMCAVIEGAGAADGPAFTGSWRPGVQSLVWHFAGGVGYDAIAARHGFLLSPDGVHPDSVGAGIIADVVGDWLDGA